METITTEAQDLIVGDMVSMNHGDDTFRVMAIRNANDGIVIHWQHVNPAEGFWGSFYPSDHKFQRIK